MAQKEEHSHRESEEKFAKAFRCSPQPFTLSTLKEDRYIEVNDAFELKTGYRREEVIGRTVDELGIWVDYAERGKLVEKIVRGEPIRNVECRFRKKTGEVFIALLSAELLELSGEMCVVANAIDITDWRRTEEALRLSEERLRLAQHAAQIGSFELNYRTGVNTWTPELETIYGLSPGSFGGTKTAFENLVHPDDRSEVIRLSNDAMKTGRPMAAEWRVVWPDGSVHWVTGRWQVFMDESGEPLRMIGVNIDITEHRLAEEARFRHAAVIESSDDAIASGTLDGIIVSWNTGAQKIYGYTEAEAVGKPISMLFPSELCEPGIAVALGVAIPGRIERKVRILYP